MKQLILIQHCQAEGQHMDSPLTQHGVNQAHRLALYLKDNDWRVDRIISSPFMRAIETIKPYAATQHIPIEQDVRLEERVLSNEPIDDWLDVLEQSFQNFDFSLSGGESSNDALKRGLAVIDECLQDESNNCAVLVTHRNLLSIILSHYLDDFGFERWKTLTNPDVFTLTFNEDTCHVRHIW
ncbi:2,3-bisphosphoglycerate-dependent phosphoglycerate mutase [Paraliobacillus sp. PM-2]|uniref:histidine phosphatase family protein n=1 Tax=Paraliobacillus sp. PM-2 TaxID=1462524 RepID=UPI00061CD8CA|nr:histidine phosphatase family protein [Paraliobacillus sp. PM-2]CQR46636.1 2,3-bisphosphoglycerate-dependent phosphoglycerate mutase [Paraliobacillus sp. PM-2]